MKRLKKTVPLLLLIFIVNQAFTIGTPKLQFKKEVSKVSAGTDKDYQKFCDAMGKLISATDNDFLEVTGKLTDSTDGVRTWKSKLDLPGVKSSFIRDEMVISKYYRGMFNNCKTKVAVKAEYDKYAQYLEKCMKAKGYVFQKAANDRGLTEFDDIIYRLPDDSSAPLEKQPFVKMMVNFDNVQSVYFISIDVNVSFL